MGQLSPCPLNKREKHFTSLPIQTVLFMAVLCVCCPANCSRETDFSPTNKRESTFLLVFLKVENPGNLLHTAFSCVEPPPVTTRDAPLPGKSKKKITSIRREGIEKDPRFIVCRRRSTAALQVEIRRRRAVSHQIRCDATFAPFKKQDQTLFNDLRR